MLEVTGNLTAGMTPVQDAIFLGVYQAEYEKLHPETKGGVAGALAKNGLQRTNLSFAEVVAEQRQVSDRTIRRVIAAGRALTRQERDALQASPHRIAISEIEKLGKIGDQPLRARAVEALLEGKKVATAIKAAKAEANGEAPPVKDPVEEAFTALCKAWARAPMAAKRKFFHAHSKEIAEMEGHGE
jgi:ParB family chromosome partitioning protein